MRSQIAIRDVGSAQYNNKINVLFKIYHVRCNTNEYFMCAQLKIGIRSKFGNY